jgi:hypothetical protein
LLCDDARTDEFNSIGARKEKVAGLYVQSWINAAGFCAGFAFLLFVFAPRNRADFDNPHFIGFGRSLLALKALTRFYARKQFAESYD